MANQVWSTPVSVGVRVPTASQDILSFNPTIVVSEAMRTVPDPAQVQQDPNTSIFEFLIPVYARPGDLAVGAWEQVFLEPQLKFLEDPAWVQPDPALDTQRCNAGQHITVFNPPPARVDGLPDPWAAQLNREPMFSWGMAVTARKLVLEDRSKVVVSAAQNTDPGARLAGVLISPDGLEAGWFGNWGGTTGTATWILNAGTYMLLVGPANAYGAQPSTQEYAGTLTVTVSLPPPLPLLFTTKEGHLWSGMTPTASVHWGHQYEFIPPVTGPYNFYMTGGFDTFLAVSDEAGTILAQNDDYGGMNSRINGLMLTGGESYYVSASAYGSGVTLMFTLGVEHPTESPSANPQVVGYKLSTIAGLTGQAAYVNGPLGTGQLVAPGGCSVSPDGYAYVIENEAIRRIDRDGVISDYIGAAGGYTRGAINGPVAQAKVDAYGNDLIVAPNGDIYFTDSSLSVRKISNGVVSTFAGPNFTLTNVDGVHCNRFDMDTQETTQVVAQSSDVRGHVDGTGTAARFKDPQGLAFDTNGNLWVADGPVIRKITPAGEVSTPYGTHGAYDPKWATYVPWNAFHGLDGGSNAPCAAEAPTVAPTVTLSMNAGNTRTYNPQFNNGPLSYAIAVVDALGRETAISPWSTPVTAVVSSAGTDLWSLDADPVVQLPSLPTGAVKWVVYARNTGSGNTMVRQIPVDDATSNIWRENFSGALLGQFSSPEEVGRMEAYLGSSKGGVRFERVQGICAGPNNTLFVVDEGLGRVVEIDLTTETTKTIATSDRDDRGDDRIGAFNSPPQGLDSWPDPDPTTVCYANGSGDLDSTMGPDAVLVSTAWVFPGQVEGKPTWPVICYPNTVSNGSRDSIMIQPPPLPDGAIGWCAYVFHPQGGSSGIWYRTPTYVRGWQPIRYTGTGTTGMKRVDDGLPWNHRGQANVEGPVGVMWDAAQKLLLITCYENIIQLYDPKTGRCRRAWGDEATYNRADYNTGRGDGIVYGSMNSPWYPRPGWDPGTIICTDWYGQTLRKLEWGVWGLPPTTKQTAPLAIAPGTIDGTFVFGEAERFYSMYLTAGKILTVKQVFLDGCRPNVRLLDAADANVPNDSASQETFGASYESWTTIWTAPADGTYRIGVSPQTYQTKAMLSRFKLIVTVT